MCPSGMTRLPTDGFINISCREQVTFCQLSRHEQVTFCQLSHVVNKLHFVNYLMS
jgi:hypothetical protein